MYAAAACLTAAAQPTLTCVERATYVMGTVLRANVCASSAAASTDAIEQGFKEVARLEGVLSSWRSDSQIGRLNAASPGSAIRLSHELAALLAEAGTWVNATGSAFDPAIGALIDVWGFRTAKTDVPLDAAIAAALRLSGWARLSLHGDTMMRGPAGWWIDTGGFGKGAALRAFAAILRARAVGSAVLDFGGQLTVIGEADVAVASPLDRERAVESLRVRDVSVSTSSQSERFVVIDGARYGHILDPRSGRPVRAWGSVTVVHPDALAADAVSTALYVMGPAAALQWAQEHPDFGVLVLEIVHGRVRATASRAMKQWLMERK